MVEYRGIGPTNPNGQFSGREVPYISRRALLYMASSLMLGRYVAAQPQEVLHETFEDFERFRSEWNFYGGREVNTTSDSRAGTQALKLGGDDLGTVINRHVEELSGWHLSFYAKDATDRTKSLPAWQLSFESNNGLAGFYTSMEDGLFHFVAADRRGRHNMNIGTRVDNEFHYFEIIDDSSRTAYSVDGKQQILEEFSFSPALRPSLIELSTERDSSVIIDELILRRLR